MVYPSYVNRNASRVIPDSARRNGMHVPAGRARGLAAICKKLFAGNPAGRCLTGAKQGEGPTGRRGCAAGRPSETNEGRPERGLQPQDECCGGKAEGRKPRGGKPSDQSKVWSRSMQGGQDGTWIGFGGGDQAKPKRSFGSFRA